MRAHVVLTVLLMAGLLRAAEDSTYAIYLDHVAGIHGSGDIMADRIITFYLGVANTPGGEFDHSNGFRVFSPDGAEWTTTTAALASEHEGMWDMCWANRYSADGIGADSVFFGCASYICYGDVVRPVDGSVPLMIQIGPIDEADVGKTICLDSSWTPPAGRWKWWPQCLGWPDVIYPDWDGPHCFTITDKCCMGEMTGNVDYDPQDLVDIGDVTQMIDYLFVSMEPLYCPEEGNVDGSEGGVVDMGDLTALISYLFIPPYTPPTVCQ